jgi:hypothetical protein
MIRGSPSGFLAKIAARYVILAGTRNRPGMTPTRRLMGETHELMSSHNKRKHAAFRHLLIVSPRVSSADEALEDELAQVVDRAISGYAIGYAGHFLHEIDQAQVEVIFDQGET